MITYQQQQQQQQFIQCLNNLPTISRAILGGQWYKIVSYKVSKKNVSEEKAKMKLNQ